jgi:CHAD domain-containing protein
LAIQTLFEDNAGSRHCFKQIKYYLHLYTRLRDLQVLKHRYKKHSGLKTLLKEEIRKEKKKIRKKIEALDPQDITTQLGTIYNVLCNEKLSIEKTRDLTQRLWLSTHKKLEQRLQSVDFENPDSLHKLRISFKPVRYVTVFFKDTGLVPSVQMDPLKYWQDILGSINDLKVAGLWLDNNPSHQEFRQQVSEYSSRAIESFKSEIGEFKQFIEQIDQQVLKATANNNLS